MIPGRVPRRLLSLLNSSRGHAAWEPSGFLSAADDDYWDEWNGLRQYAGQSLLKHAVKLSMRRRFICRFWHWRLVARNGTLQRWKRAESMYAAMRHVVDVAAEAAVLAEKWLRPSTLGLAPKEANELSELETQYLVISAIS